MIVKVKLVGIGVVAVLCFIMGALWYSPLLFGNMYFALRGMEAGSASTPSQGQFIAEIVRCVISATCFALLIIRLGIVSVKDALELAFLIWIGFQGFVLIGSVIHEGYLVKLFAIHAGDALIKAMISCVLLALWHKRAAPTVRS